MPPFEPNSSAGCRKRIQAIASTRGSAADQDARATGHVTARVPDIEPYSSAGCSGAYQRLPVRQPMHPLFMLRKQ